MDVERQIRDAVARGDFDNLPGAGKPLDLGDPNDPDWWVKGFMQREGLRLGDALPPLFVLRQQRQSWPDALVEIGTEDGVRTVLTEYNRAVRDELLRRPPGPAMPVIARTVDVEDMVRRWQELRAALPSARPGAAAATSAGGARSGWLRRLARSGRAGSWPGRRRRSPG